MNLNEVTKRHENDPDLRSSYLNFVTHYFDLVRSEQIPINGLRLEANLIADLFLEKHFPEVKLSFEDRMISFRWIDEHLKEFLNRNFHKMYSTLWELSLATSDIWPVFLESFETKFKRQRALFKYYWTLYNSYTATRLLVLSDDNFEARCGLNADDHFFDEYQPWLLEKCFSTRIKLITSLSERQLVDHISDNWSEFLTIDNIENFVNSNFSYPSSNQRTKSYPYEIKLNNLASKFLTYLGEEDKILSHFSFCENGGERLNKPIDIQLWLEFIFRGHKGFTENSIEEYYLPQREKKKLR